MKTKIYVKPKEGLTVRNLDEPGYPKIKPEGQFVEKTTHIIRQLKDGDLFECDPYVKATHETEEPIESDETAEADDFTTKSV